MFLSLPPQHNRTFPAVEVRPQEQYRPPHQVHAHPRVVEQRSDVIIRPDVIVDAVIDLHEAIRRVVEGLGTGCVTLRRSRPSPESGRACRMPLGSRSSSMRCRSGVRRRRASKVYRLSGILSTRTPPGASVRYQWRSAARGNGMCSSTWPAMMKFRIPSWNGNWPASPTTSGGTICCPTSGYSCSRPLGLIRSTYQTLARLVTGNFRHKAPISTPVPRR